MNLIDRKKCIVILILLTASLCYAQSDPTPLTQNEKKEVVDSVGRSLIENYIFPDVAKKARDTLFQNLNNGVYDSIGDPFEFADKLTADVVSITADKHFHVFFDPERVADERSSDQNEAVSEKEIESWRKDNFGFEQVKILEGNIGYVNLTAFQDLKYAKETATATMSFLSNADAIIIDLRYNHGGDSATAQFLSSYFFSDEPVLLYDFFTREKNENKLTHYTTLPFVPGKRMPSKDLYFLTSTYSFSASEGFVYALQNLKRATVVGETSGGGANMWTGKIATDRFYLHIPNARPVDPRTKTNWEGIGVKPDIAVSAQNALTTAHITALERLAASSPGSEESRRYKWYLLAVRAKLTPINLSVTKLKSYAGNYGNISITFEGGKLFFRSRGAKSEMSAQEQNVFGIEGFNFFRLKFMREKSGVSSLTMINDDGTSRTFTKTK